MSEGSQFESHKHKCSALKHLALSRGWSNLINCNTLCLHYCITVNSHSDTIVHREISGSALAVFYHN